MRIAVSSQGQDLDAASSPVFGRCPTFVFVETDTMEYEAQPNPAMSQGGGAGIQAAQFVVNQGASVVLTGNLGPNAFDVLQAAGVCGYLVSEGTVRQAVEAYRAGRLQAMGGASVAAHAGIGRGGSQSAVRSPEPPVTPAEPAEDIGYEAELDELRSKLKGLRQQLAETVDRIESLERENRGGKET